MIPSPSLSTPSQTSAPPPPPPEPPLPANVPPSAPEVSIAPPVAPNSPTRRVLGYYVPYDPTSWATLESQADSIDVVAAQWVTIDGCGRLTSDDDQDLKRFARSRGIKVVPSLLTLSRWLNSRILTDPETTDRALGDTVTADSRTMRPSAFETIF